MKRLVLTLIVMGLAMNSAAAAGERSRVNLNQVLNHKHSGLFRATESELLVYGGAGAGKSYSIADKLFLQGIINPHERQKIVVIRKTLASLRKSTLDIIERRAAALHRPFRLDRSSWTAQCGNQTWVFTGINNREDYQKIKSLTDVNFIWVNELTELREDDYKELSLRLRGAVSKSRFGYRQLISDFNPIGKTSWIYERFWQKLPHAAKKLRYTVLDNPWAEPEYIARLKATAKDDLNFHKIYFLGDWGELQGIIFSWDVVPLPNIAFDETFYGGDFGYTIDPAALVKIYRRANEYWLEEKIYQTGLTNPDLAALCLSSDVGVKETDDTYWDSAEPKSIQELNDNSLNAKPSLKGPDSVRATIDFLLSKKIHIVEGSPNLIKEVRSYVRKKDKDGHVLPVPIAFNDHAIKAAGYGIYTHAHSGPEVFIGQSGGDVY
jgi:phage terminase large subunit